MLLLVSSKTVGSILELTVCMPVTEIVSDQVSSLDKQSCIALHHKQHLTRCKQFIDRNDWATLKTTDMVDKKLQCLYYSSDHTWTSALASLFLLINSR